MRSNFLFVSSMVLVLASCNKEDNKLEDDPFNWEMINRHSNKSLNEINTN
ncbi:hypothetical protein SAMN05661044_02506 [Olivibacter domesticus]|uniref:Uncharacterized protein n=1 Tax=Olivibacter domesticus TaxID=407022 RepID=A0A1H7Q8W1_OLID1|nr:hypothetical protein SAMN05661044_02506 [Olivibacter domesticus]